MKLAEFLHQGKQLRRQGRTFAIAYFEQCLQSTTDTNEEGGGDCKNFTGFSFGSD